MVRRRRRGREGEPGEIWEHHLSQRPPPVLIRDSPPEHQPTSAREPRAPYFFFLSLPCRGGLIFTLKEKKTCPISRRRPPKSGVQMILIGPPNMLGNNGRPRPTFLPLPDITVPTYTFLPLPVCHILDDQCTGKGAVCSSFLPSFLLPLNDANTTISLWNNGPLQYPAGGGYFHPCFRKRKGGGRENLAPTPLLSTPPAAQKHGARKRSLLLLFGGAHQIQLSSSSLPQNCQHGDQQPPAKVAHTQQKQKPI